MTAKKKAPPKKAAKKVSAKKAAPKKTLLFTIREKSKLDVEGIEPEDNRQVKFKAVCLFEQKDLTDWTDESTADAAAEDHRNNNRHPVTVLESH